MADHRARQIFYSHKPNRGGDRKPVSSFRLQTCHEQTAIILTLARPYYFFVSTVLEEGPNGTHGHLNVIIFSNSPSARLNAQRMMHVIQQEYRPVQTMLVDRYRLFGIYDMSKLVAYLKKELASLRWGILFFDPGTGDTQETPGESFRRSVTPTSCAAIIDRVARFWEQHWEPDHFLIIQFVISFIKQADVRPFLNRLYDRYKWGKWWFLIFYWDFKRACHSVLRPDLFWRQMGWELRCDPDVSSPLSRKVRFDTIMASAQRERRRCVGEDKSWRQTIRLNPCWDVKRSLTLFGSVHESRIPCTVPAVHYSEEDDRRGTEFGRLYLEGRIYGRSFGPVRGTCVSEGCIPECLFDKEHDEEAAVFTCRHWPATWSLAEEVTRVLVSNQLLDGLPGSRGKVSGYYGTRSVSKRSCREKKFTSGFRGK